MNMNISKEHAHSVRFLRHSEGLGGQPIVAVYLDRAERKLIGISIL